MHHHQSINLKPPEPVSLPVYSDLNEQWQIVFFPCKCLLEVSMGVGKLNRSLKADNDSAWVISQHKQYCNISLNCHLECVIKYPKPLYWVNQKKYKHVLIRSNGNSLDFLFHFHIPLRIFMCKFSFQNHPCFFHFHILLWYFNVQFFQLYYFFSSFYR